MDHRRVFSGAGAFFTFLALFFFSGGAAGQGEGWKIEERKFDGPWGTATVSKIAPEEGGFLFTRGNIGQACMTRVFDVDLGATPAVEIETGAGNAQWRLTGQVGEGPEIVLADHQTEGVCRRDMATRLAASGSARIRIRLVTWGWGGSDKEVLALRRVAFTAAQPETDATALSGLMKEREERVLTRARAIRPVRLEHPSLRYRAADRPGLQEKARTSHRVFVAPILERIDGLDGAKKEAPLVLDGKMLGGEASVWRAQLVRLRPADPPSLRRGEGWSPVGESGARVETTWRQMCWHFSSGLVIASALSDDVFWAEQAKRWALGLARWRFWLEPGYSFFDFQASYPLQNLAFFYDVGWPAMSDAERGEAREAIAYIARALYLNTLTGHGSIYNDLRGNHTAVAMCGLGVAGLALLGEHPDAAKWVALAEQFMLDAFEAHGSGAWLESPSYGNYGVNEWLKFGEMLRNVTGRDHLKNPFLKRFAEYQLMICDWEGRDLGYNQGGAGMRWNHWIFLLIARELRDARVQWLANFAVDADGMAMMGYGDAFWWGDPSLRAERPSETNVGRLFDDVGLGVWRDGWGDRSTILLFHCGAKGQHKEENVGHFTLYAAGARVLPDGVGTKTADHNVPEIGGKGQHLYAAGKMRRFSSDGQGGYALGDMTGPYRGAKVQREVLYLRSGAAVVIDELGARGEPVTLRLHPQGETRLAGSTVVVDSGDSRLLAAFAGGGRAVTPTVTARGGKGAERATHDVEATVGGTGTVRALTFLRFGEKQGVDASGVTVAEEGGATWFAVGGERWAVGTRAGAVGAGVETDAPLWFARVEGDRVKDLMAVGADGDAAVSIGAAGEKVAGRGFATWGGE